jgi:hypothetical protein
MLLCIINDDDLMEKWIDFVKIKFHLNENIEWHRMQFELKFLNLMEFDMIWIYLNWIPIQLKSIQWMD